MDRILAEEGDAPNGTSLSTRVAPVCGGLVAAPGTSQSQSADLSIAGSEQLAARSVSSSPHVLIGLMHHAPIAPPSASLNWDTEKDRPDAYPPVNLLRLCTATCSQTPLGVGGVGGGGTDSLSLGTNWETTKDKG